MDINDYEYKLYIYVLYILLYKLSGYITFFQKPTLYWDQVLEKMKESYILFGRMLLKTSFQEYEFDDIYSIPFEDLGHSSCKEKLASESEFKEFLSDRYPRIV